MKPKRTPRKEIASLCSRPGEEDGADPRRFFGERPDRSDRKSIQLAGQVARTLRSLLAGESGEEILQALSILAVEPAPDSSHFLVVVTGPVAESEALAALGRASAWLRTEVAAAVRRRKAPELTYRFIEEMET
jgi:ribosome-binding factor A